MNSEIFRKSFESQIQKTFPKLPKMMKNEKKSRFPHSFWLNSSFQWYYEYNYSCLSLWKRRKFTIICLLDFFLFGKVLKFLGLLRNSFNFHEKYLPLATLVKIKRLFENGLKNWSLSDRSSYVSAQITRLAPF